MCVHGHTPWLWCRERVATELPVYRVNGQSTLQIIDVRSFGQSAPFGVTRVDTQTPIGQLDFMVAASAIDFGVVAAAASTRTPDGGLQFVLGGSDHLFWGDVSGPDHAAQFVITGPSGFHFAVVPQPGASISSVAVLDGSEASDAGAKFAEGYAVASGGVYRFAADNEVVWSTEEQRITTAEAAAVWTDGRRGRVVFRDGSVFGLPSRVPLSAALSPGASTVKEVEAFCGQVFALTGGGLYQLKTGDGVLAQWQRIELGVPAAALVGGKLIAEESALFVALPDGQSRLVSGFTCVR